MQEAFICKYVRTPIGRFGGALANVRADDLAAKSLIALLDNTGIDPYHIDEVVFGCANQAGEDNRNVARMSTLLAGLPDSIPGTTINRLCGSGMDSILMASRAIRSGESDLIIAGGVESMTRAPFVMPKASSAFSRQNEVFDTTIGWRFINPVMKAQFGVDSMPETAENVAEDFRISREDQDKFAFLSQQKTKKAQLTGRLSKEIFPIEIIGKKREVFQFSTDEHPRETTLEKLATLKTPFRENGTITAGNSSGVNDGAAAVIIASENAIKMNNLNPIARILGGSSVGVEPRIMGIGPSPAVKKLLNRLNLTLDEFEIIELNEAFASQSIACIRQLGCEDSDPRININGGAIALGHPLGMSGTRITGSAALELKLQRKKFALATMCVGVGQGIAIALQGVLR